MAGLLAVAQRHLVVDRPDRLATAVTRSHLADGRCVGWVGPVPPGWAVAVDAEIGAAAVPPALARRFGTERFWQRWTRTECLCKLSGYPILLWCARFGLAAPGEVAAPGKVAAPAVHAVSGGLTAAVFRTLAVHDLVVSVAAAPVWWFAAPPDSGDKR